jgi:putative ABC transport system permease protein
MFRNYLTIAYRSFLKQKGHTILNLFGLSLGLASAMCIFMYVNDELSYDTFYEGHEDVYAIGVTFYGNDGNVESYPVVPGGWAMRIKQDVGEVAAAVKSDWFGYPTTLYHKSADKIILSEEIRWTGPDFGKVFPLKMVRGDIKNALKEPSSLLVSETGARRLFGDIDPIGQQVTAKHPWMGDGSEIELLVTGVYKDLPMNTHYRPMFIGNSEAMRPNFGGGFDQYYNSMNTEGGFFTTYVRLSEGSSTTNLLNELKRLTEESSASDSTLQANGGRIDYFIRPITELHFDEDVDWEMDAKGDKQYLAIFSSVAMLILLIACINYMNLATARSSKRAKEVGMRKTLGGTRGELATQFLQESAFMAVTALLLAFLIAVLIIPYFNTLSNKAFTAADLFSLNMLIIIVGTVIFVTLVGGSYPAFFLSGFKPVDVLKGRFTKGKGAEFFRRSLVALQFIVSMILVIATGIIIRQMNFIQNSKLNEKGNQILSVRYGGTAPNDKYPSLKNALLQDPEIEHVTMGNHLPRMDWFGSTNATFRFPEIDDQDYRWHQLNVDFDFPAVYGLELLAGRLFDPENAADSGSFLINEAALKILNKTPDDALGLGAFEVRANMNSKVIGVVKDFPFQSAYHAIQPLVLNPRLHPIDRILYAEIPAGKMSEKIASLEATWKKILPGVGFDYWFLGDEFSRMYETERRISALAKGFAILALLITGLGLYGLASYSAEQKTKEVGIRKVMGASVKQVVTLFLTSFFKIFIVAMVFAVPTAWYMGDQWLSTFVYRESMDAWIFITSVAGLMIITLLTVSYETIKAAISDPIKAIRHE